MSRYNASMNRETMEEAAALLASCRTEFAKRIVGQSEMIDGLLCSLIAGGHALLEGVPGLAKTLAVKTLSELSGLSFKRIQFTPDLLPADLTGTLIWEQANSRFSVRRGPVFANLVLADEINRAPAKVQSALLEAMEEHQVTIGEETHSLPEPFFVLATQNPIEQEGTYMLPEAELDRFLLKLLVQYPSREEEKNIINKMCSDSTSRSIPSVVLDTERLRFLKECSESVHVDEKITEYIVSITAATRPLADRKKASRDDLYRYISFGASPRASLALYRCARIQALFGGRDYVIPEDIKAISAPVLRHRLVLSYEAEADGMDADAVISRILAFVPLP